MIILENVSKTFQTKQAKVEAVKGIHLHVRKGEIHGVIGYSGAGKSTLIRCVNLLERPTKGKVIIDSEEITSLTGQELRKKRRKIGMIFQGFNLLQTANVYENIAIPLKLTDVKKEEIDKRVRKYIDIVGLTERIYAYPNELSGGQKQRVAIARALAQEPEILLSDEATSALDPETTESILNLLLKINKEFGITILLITHEMNVIQKVCDYVYVMEKGEVVEKGTVSQLFTNPHHETTKKFLQLGNEYPIAKSLVEQLRQTGSLLRLTFTGKTTSEPVLALITEKHSVKPNIIQAHIVELKNEVIGNLVIHLTGNKADIRSTQKFLNDYGVAAEVLEEK